MKFTLAISMCDPSHYIPLARAAEVAGWDAVCVPEGGPWTETTTVAYRGGRRWWGPETPFLDPFAVIPAMAAVTERIHFHTNVYKLPIRSPLLTARTVATASVLSGGRVGLGVGLGWNKEEFEAHGIEYAVRAGRTDEALEILRLLWRGGPVEYHGRHFDFAPLQQSPLPAGPVPIYVGGDSEAAMRRAARFGDGWCARAPEPDDVAALVPRLEAALERAERRRNDFVVMAMCPTVQDVDGFRGLADAGVDEVQVWPWNRYDIELGDLPGKLDAVERFAAEVIEPMRIARGD